MIVGRLAWSFSPKCAFCDKSAKFETQVVYHGAGKLEVEPPQIWPLRPVVPIYLNGPFRVLIPVWFAHILFKIKLSLMNKRIIKLFYCGIFVNDSNHDQRNIIWSINFMLKGPTTYVCINKYFEIYYLKFIVCFMMKAPTLTKR